MRRCFAIAAPLLFFLLSTRPVLAEEPPESQLGPDYRVQMILTDVAAMGVFAAAGTLGYAGSITDKEAAAGLGIGYVGFIASGAVYHEMYDLTKRTWKSALVRALAPPLFGVLGIGFDTCDSTNPGGDCSDKRVAAMMVGAIVGMFGATVADATILVPEGRKPPPRPQAGITFMPTASVRADAAQAGIVGRF
jgi:hypothetical protein